MNGTSRIATIVVLCALLALAGGMASAVTLTGRVYEGQTGVEPPPLGDAKPLAGVTVTLYGSNHAGQEGVYIRSTTTDSEGWYGLEVERGFEFYSIVETDPAGYTSVGASTVDGSVISSNWIQYAYPLDGKTLTGNKFWDMPELCIINVYKFQDNNGDCAWDATTEPPLANWKICLDLNQNCQCDPGEPFELTDATGWCWFEVPCHGTYYLAEEQKPGWERTCPATPPCEVHIHTASPLAAYLVQFGNRPVPAEQRDYGDAPDTYGTLKASSGASHLACAVHLGATVDTESDGKPTNDAQGDDNAGIDDEDGLAYSSVNCLTGFIELTVSNDGSVAQKATLAGWIDFNGNKQFDTWGLEMIGGVQVTVPAHGTINHLFHFPVLNAVPGPTYARFRLYLPDPDPMAPAIAILPYGEGRRGEVEDYQIEIVGEFGDAPEGAIAYPSTGVMGEFPTCKGGPAGHIYHKNPDVAYFGGEDGETDGNGGTCPGFPPYDQDEGFNDGDAGLIKPEPYTINAQGKVVPCAGGTGTPLGKAYRTATWGSDIDISVQDNLGHMFVNVLIDWNQDGRWGGASWSPGGGTAPEHVLVNAVLPPGQNSGPLSILLAGNISFQIGPNPGYVWARFTISDVPVPADWDGSGTFDFGETEDYLLYVAGEDFGDALDFGGNLTMAPNGSWGSIGLMSIREVVDNGTIATQGDCWNSLGNIALPAFVADYMAPMLNIEDGGAPGNFPNNDVFGVVQVNQKAYGNVDDLSLAVMGAIRIPSSGDYTFCVGSDDGFTFQIDRYPAFSYWGDRAFADSVKTFNLPAGDHFFLLTYHEHGGAAGLELSAAKGAKSAFDSSFQLIGSPGGLQLVNPPSYPTVLTHNGARHTVVSDFHLGQGVDSEPDGQSSPDALGDDNADTDDEDGVFFLTPIMPGGTAELEIVASASGFVDAWIDFEGDGNWNQPSDRILNAQPVQAGANPVTIVVPASAQSGIVTFARFRLSRTGGLPCDGEGQDGEVEDYHILLGGDGPFVPGEGEERLHLKWSQPMIEIDPKVGQTPVFCGWDEPAFSVQTSGRQRRWTLVADDFHCLGPIPVTSIRWWGSFAGWTEDELPSVAPTAFHIGIWTGAPADAADSQSRPEKLVWEKTCDDWTWQWAGYERSAGGSGTSIPSVGLVAHYQFDGNANDSSGNSLHGTAYGGPSYVPGVLGQAISLDGINDYVNCGNSPLFNITEAITLSAWVNPADAGNGQHNPFVTKGDQAYAIKHNISNQIETFIYEGGWHTATYAVDASFNGGWHHVASTYDGVNLRLYVDGVLRATTAYVGAIAGTTYNVNLGRNSQNTDRFYEGLLDEVRVYNRALNADEIKGLAVVSPQQRTDEACFEFNCDLPTEDWFHQDRFPTQGQVFWLSITALYGGSSAGPNPWGWASRPAIWQDGAVGFAWTGQQPLPGLVLDPKGMTAVQNDACGYEQACDMAFELRTDPDWVKWDEPFTGIRDWPYYDDHASYATESANGVVTIVQQVADDWPGEGPSYPVIAMAWQGSYLGYGYEACRCDPMNPPRRPDYFQLLIRTNLPPSAGNPLDRPGDVVWAYEAFDYDEVLVGYDRNPAGEPNEPVFRYTVRLPRDQWFRHEGDQAYWLSIMAVYVAAPAQIKYPWGWTNHEHQFGSAASTLSTGSQGLVCQPLSGPAGGLIDMSFTLYTTSESRPIAHWRFDETQGTIAVDSASGHNGVVHGAAWTTGAAGGALRFDGGDYVEVSDEAAFDISDAITAAAWVNLEAVPADYIGIVTKGDSTWRLSTLQAQRRFHFAVNDPQGAFHAVDGTTGVGLNEWHHVMGTYDGSSLRLYVDGVEEPSSPVAHVGPIHVDDFLVWIGANAERPGRGFVGRIDEVLVYDRALTLTEVLEVMAPADNKTPKGSFPGG